MKVEVLSDAELVDIISSKGEGMEEAMEQTMKRYKNMLFAYIVGFLRDKHISEDVLQEVFVRFYITIKTFDKKRKLSTWLFRIAHNKCIDYLRKKKEAPNDIFPEFKTTDENQKTVAEDVVGVISKLDEDSRSILLLRDALGYEYSEITEILGVPTGTVKSRISRAREKFKTAWQQMFLG